MRFNLPNVLGLTIPEKKIIFAVLSILIGLCTLAYFAHRYSQRLIKASEAIERDEDLKHHIHEVLSISVDMEAGIRGFVLTGNEEYLGPVNQNIAELFMHLKALSGTPDITPAQKQHIAELQKLADEKADSGTRIVEVRRQKGMADAVALIENGKDQQLLNQIRSIAGEMLQTEDASLSTLKAEQHRAIHHFAITYYFLLFKISITVVTVVFLFFLYFRKRNKSEKTLTATKELFHNILDHTSALISIKDLSGRYLLVNKTFEKTFDVQEKAIKGKTSNDLFGKEVADIIRNTDIEVIRLQKQLKIEEIVPKGGDMRHFISLKFPLFDAHQIPYAICCISTDETEKIQFETQHQEQMSRILDLFNNAPCGYQATDQSGTIIEINETLLKWLGYTREEVVGKISSRELISPESQHLFTYYFPLLKTREITSVFDVEVSYQRKDGSRLPIVANTIAQYDEQGQFMYTRTSVFDMSYRRREEEVMAKN